MRRARLIILVNQPVGPTTNQTPRSLAQGPTLVFSHRYHRSRARARSYTHMGIRSGSISSTCTRVRGGGWGKRGKAGSSDALYTPSRIGKYARCTGRRCCRRTTVEREGFIFREPFARVDGCVCKRKRWRELLPGTFSVFSVCGTRIGMREEVRGEKIFEGERGCWKKVDCALAEERAFDLGVSYMPMKMKMLIWNHK